MTFLRFSAIALVCVASIAHAQTPKRVLVPVLDVAAIQKSCDLGLQRARARIADMEKTKGAGKVLAEWNDLSLYISDLGNIVDLLANVSPDQATRDAAQACVEELTPLSTELFQSRALFARVNALKPRDAIDTMYRKRLIEGFEDSGAALPDDKRARVKEIREELDKIGLAFQKNVNEDKTLVAISPAEAAGLPDAWIAARKRDGAGNLLVTMDYPTYVPFMQNAVSGVARERVWRADQNRAGQVNIDLLDHALALRRELAAFYGAPDYASFVLPREMAQTPQAVNAFLKQVKDAISEPEKRELAELAADKAALLNLPPEQVRIERWDVQFHQERLRKARFHIDQEVLRAYFPTEQSVQYTMRVAEILYGIEFVPATVPVWHPDVRYYDVYDRDDGGKRGAFIGGVYLDMFPRDGKYSHAAAFAILPASREAGRTPTSVLVTNFNRVGLNHDELETLMHEFGHVLHGVLSRARYADLAGTSVKRDFVEAPSQMFEEWARREETLKLFAEICPSCPRLNSAQIQQLDQARKFGAAVRYTAQWTYASYDMRLHNGPPRQAMPTWIDLLQPQPLGYVPGTMFPASFAHLMSGYAAGYYGYMWSEVLALDMLAGFKGHLMDPAAGRRYRRIILSVGGEREPQDIVQEFLGRKPNTDAFFAEVAGTR